MIQIIRPEMAGLLSHTRWKSTIDSKTDDSSLNHRTAIYSRRHNNVYLKIILLVVVLQSLFHQGLCQESEKKRFSIQENVPVGTSVGLVDSRSGYTYELVTNTEYFNIDPLSGEIKVKQLIDRELLNKNDIKFVVKQKLPREHTLIEVIVTIIDVNDNSPRFRSAIVNYTIAENDLLLQPFTLTATDPDDGVNGSSSLTYSILSGNEGGYWHVTTKSTSGAKSAELALINEVDREEIGSFRLVLEARDGGTPSKSGTIIVNVVVLDLNDNHPKFDFTLYSADVAENASIGDKILETRAVDLDAGINSALAFSMADNPLFSINRLTGEIYLEASLLTGSYLQLPSMCQTNYCNSTLCLSVCFLEIQVSDQEGEGSSRLVDQSRVRIAIIDVNNHAPVITLSIAEPTVSEDVSVNTRIFYLTVNDADKGRNGEWDLTYVAGNELNHFKQPQCIRIFCLIRTNVPIDKEKISRYNLTFAATDRGVVPRRTTISVIVHVLDANDHSPVFISAPYSASVSELNPVNSFVAAVTATDADEDENGRVTYQISDGNSKQFFKIDSDSGLVTVNRRLDSDSLSVPKIILNISASDHGSNVLRSETTLTVDIVDENDEIPEFTEPEYHVQVAENNLPNVTLTTVSANDRDSGANGSVRYVLSDETLQEYAELFYIGAVSGELEVSRSLDREMQDQYTLIVVAHDLGTVVSLKSQVTVRINVTDVNDNSPIFYPNIYYTVIPESAGVGYPVTSVTATDQDIGNNGQIRYSISPSSSSNNRFGIEQNSGLVSVARALSTSQRSYTIQVEATDGGGKLARATVHLKIGNPEERDPEFPRQTYRFTVEEDADGSVANINQIVGTVTANASTILKYFIVDGDPEETFAINENTGVITTIKRLDRDTIPAYHLTVVAEGISKTASTSVNITVGDKNDNSPVFDESVYHVETPEDTPLNGVVFVAQATDKDAGSNARITYTMSASEADRLAVDPTTGAVRLTKMIRLGETLRLTIIATDGGLEPRSSSAEVIIKASDVNDHSPVFDEREYNVVVNESDLINTRFLQLHAVDEDLGRNAELTYSLISGVNKTRPEFGVFPDGSLYIAQKLDRETKDRYQLMVEAQDHGSPLRRSDTAIVYVKILDDNDNTPQFSTSQYEFRVLEGKNPGAYIGSVSARDADIGRNSDLMYFFTTNQQNFDLDPFTGEIRSKKVFDREERPRYTLTVRAVDNGVTHLHTEANVAVVVEDINDNSPIFGSAVYDLTISEDVAVGPLINPITATDPDLDMNGEVKYSIIAGNKKGHFSLDETNGIISVKSPLDRDIQAEYNLLIKATDNGRPPLSSNATVHIKLEDANNRSPKFNRPSYSVNVKEDAEVGAVIGQVSATDDDLGVNAVIEYSITEGNEDGIFSIVRGTGQLQLAKSLNYEFKQLYSLTIRASNRPPNPLYHQTRFSINVEDVNDNRPRFTDDLVTTSVLENQVASTFVGQVTANDSDSGANGRVSYAIVSQPAPEKFRIDGDGKIFTLAPIDRENNGNSDVVDEYSVVVEATDRATPASARLSVRKTIVISISDVNDNAPQFVSPVFGVIQENSESGTEVMTVQAIDKDAGRNAQVIYSLKSGTSVFRIDPSSGLITSIRSVSTTPVVHRVTVRAADRGEPQLAAEQSVQIVLTSSISSGLQFTNSQSFKSILETSPIGTDILTLTSSDSNVEYFVTNVKSLGQTQPALFKMSSEPGKMKTAMDLDRDQGFVNYTVEVFLRDKASSLPRTTKTDVLVMLLDVNDSPPKFSSALYTADCSEDAAIGYIVISLTAADPDQHGSVSYSLANGTESFAINSLGEVKVAGILDRETSPIHVLTIQASDGTYTSTTQLTINILDINDEAPKFDRPFYTLSISEKASPGDIVGRVSASDDDLGVGGEVMYELLTVWGSDTFAVNRQSGVISLLAALDYETIQLYVLQVEAKDKDPSNPLTSNITVYINVIDENDNEPTFSPSSYNPSISEASQPGSPVVTVSAFDDDAGMNGRVHYSILQKDLPFAIDASNGTIYTSRELDRETVAEYNIIVQAEDYAIENPMSSTARVSVTIDDSNDNDPQFLPPYSLHVSEAAQVSSHVATIRANDADAGANGNITFSLLNNRELFSLGEADGALMLLNGLDRETKAMYSLRVKAEDRGVPSRAATQTYTIVVDDVNDNSPNFLSNQSTSVQVREDQAPGEVLLTIEATDADTGLSSEIRYYILSGDPNEDFHLDQLTGKLSVSRGLDYERTQQYSLTIQAEDLGPAPRFSTIEIDVTVLDWNDCAPVFHHSPYYVYLQEETTQLPVELVTVHATDADSLQYNQSTYELLFGLDDKSQESRTIFSIERNTGVLSAVRSVDREVTSSFTLKVIAQNVVPTDGVQLTGEAVVHVIVKDINDHAPTFDLPIYSKSLLEGDAIGREIIQVTATDRDIGSNGEVRYALVNNSASDFFSINFLTGWISNTEALDREISDRYDLIVVAYDMGAVSQSSESDVKIYLEDINDNSPSFSQDLFTVRLRDQTADGEFVIGTTAIDPDRGSNGKVTYSLRGANAAQFAIDPDTGVITAAAVLAGPADIQVNVRATDGGNRVADATVKVVFNSFSPSLKPEFQDSLANILLLENRPLDFLVVKVTAVPQSEGGSVLYSIAGGNVADAFSVKPDGKVVVNTNLDYAVASHYDLWIEATDSLNGISSYKNINVTIEDVNDHVPQFEQALYIASAEEEQNILSPEVLVRVKASDDDSGIYGQVRYTLLAGNIGNPFVVGQIDGMVKLTKRLDRESIPRYELTIAATDGGGLNSTAIVIVNVLDINDKFPRFESIYKWSLPEDTAVGSVVAAVHARDSDVGVNADVVYSMETPSSHFDITSTGNVTVKAALDRESQSSYDVVVNAKNTGSESAISATTTIKITVTDVNDNAPEFIPSSQYNVTFAEKQEAGSVVTVINTEDRDSEGPNSLVMYQLVNPSSFFIIDTSSGTIRSKDVLEYDVTGIHNVYNLYVEATDSGVPSRTSIASVNITILDANDHAPQFAEVRYFTAVPDDTNQGKAVLTVTAKDTMDYGLNAVVSYSVVGGNGSSLFGVIGTNGTIYVKNPLVSHTGEYRTIRVKAEDEGVPSQSSVVDVTMLVTQENRYAPVWQTAAPLTLNVSESRNPGYEIAEVQAEDSDTGINAEVKYSLQTPNEFDASLFHIGSLSGRITLAQRLDYERHTIHRVTLQAQDMAFNPRLVYTTLTINVLDTDDNPPIFTQQKYTASVAENMPINVLVLTVRADDADTGQNAAVRYSIVGSGGSSNFFSIDDQSGEITTQTSFDYETRDSYTLMVKASNPFSDKYESTAQVQINIKGVNEFAPSFIMDQYSFSVSESVGIGYKVGRLRATDDDGGLEGEVEFMLVGDSNDHGFSIERDTGDLFVSGLLDRESVQYIDLIALVKNPGPVQGNDTDTVMVRVSLDDANDSPRFSENVYNASIAENQGSGVHVITVKATDADQQVTNSRFSYALGRSFDGLFSINPDSGKITTTGPLDREVQSVYAVAVEAIDEGSPPKTGQAVVYVRVTDVNDNPPHFEPAVPVGEVLEGSDIGTSILDLSRYTFDRDITPNQGPYRYNMTSDHFTINSNTGIIYTNFDGIDFEQTKEYTLNVGVTDRGGKSAQLQAKIVVKDLNDNPSSSRDLTVIVQSNGLVVDGVIGSVEPLDIDEVGNYTCSMSGQPHFSIPSASCQLRALQLTSDKSLTVSGNDGVHSTVQSTVNVKVRTYTSTTLNAATVTRISGISVQKFVERSEVFLASIKKHLSDGDSARLLAIGVEGRYIDLYMVLQKADNTFAQISSSISTHKASIESDSGFTISAAKRDVCTSQSCSGRGECRSQMVVSENLEYQSTDSLTLTYHSSSLLPKCKCNQEYMGDDCSEEAGACRSAPCMNGAGCAPIGESRFECMCTPQWTGNQCQNDVNECEGEINICQNGGSCVNEVGSYRCDCTDDYKGPRCEDPIRCVDRDPCMNGAQCIDQEPSGYLCKCADGFYGDQCQHSSYGFEEMSYMELAPMSSTSNDIQMTIATKSLNALLLFQPGTDKNFMALQIINGSVVFKFRGGGYNKQGILVSKVVSSGSWYRIHATRTPTSASLEVVYCDSIDVCVMPCNDQADCYSSDSFSNPTNSNLTIEGQQVSIGGVANLGNLLRYAGFVRFASFVGCIGNLRLDGKVVDLSQAVVSSEVKDTCPRLSSAETTEECNRVCGQDYQCHAWFYPQCTCEGFYSTQACDNVLIDNSVSITPDTSIMYKYRQGYRSSVLLSASRKRRTITADSSRLFLTMRTAKDGVLMKTEPADATKTLEVVDGHASYGGLKNDLVSLTDGEWHQISLIVTETSTILTVDNQATSDNTSTTVDFLDIHVVSALIVADKFEGCIKDVILNGDRLPMSDALTDKFEIVVTGSDSLPETCDGCPATTNFCGKGKTCDASGGTVACVVKEEPTSGMSPVILAVIIVVAVVCTLCIIFATVCIVNRCRKRKLKGKSSATVKSTAPIMTSQINESDFNGGHDNLPEREILASERNNMTRNFNNMSPAVGHLQSSRTVPSPYQPLEDSTVIIEGSVTGGLNTDKFNSDQFYDLSETGSIAPSDVDIRKYYKGYRKGDNMEMQMIPKHMRQHANRSPVRTSPIPHSTPMDNSTRYTTSPIHRHSPLTMNAGYDNNRQETPISQLQQRHRHHTPIDELNRRIALEQRADVTRRDSESSLTDGSMVRQPHWTNARSGPLPNSRPSSRSASRQNSRPASRQQMPIISNLISTQRQQDLNRLSHRSVSSSLDSDDDLARRQPMERNIYSEACDSSSDESSNDSFTASEFEADEPKVRNDYQPTNMMFTKLQEVEDESDTGDPNAYRTTFSWDGLRNVDNSLQRFINNSDSNTDLDSMTKGGKKPQPAFRWDHFLSWGPSFEKLVGVFADIAELPQDYMNEIDVQSLHDSEDYV